MTDQELLRAFVDRRDDAAFREIVNRYVNVVYASARRQIQDRALAEDVTQAVFIMLAKKAPTLREGVILAGWLITSARFAAKAAARAEGRRKRREEQAAAMNSTLQDCRQSPSPISGTEAIDEDLDLALSRLRPTDRAVVTMRYLQSKPLREVAETLGINEAAAAKRVSRALGKLRDTLSRRGFVLTPVVLIEAMEKQSHIAAPAALAEASAQAVLGESQALTRAAEIAAAALLLASSAAAMSLGLKLTAATVLLAALGAGWMYSRPIAPAPQPTVVVAVPQVIVGQYVSLKTALKRSTDGNRNWNGQFDNVKELESAPGVRLIPIIEPGSDADVLLMKQLRIRYRDEAPIVLTDVASLQKIDVILASHVCYPTDEALTTLDEAVRGGKGLIIRQCLGGDDGGYMRPVVRELKGLSDASPDALRATKFGSGEVLTRHPLLGKLTPGQTISIKAYGAQGAIDWNNTALVSLTTADAVVYDKLGPLKQHAGFGIYPLTAGTLGRGRIVGCAFAEVPVELDTATDGKFVLRAVRWAAKKPLD